MDFQLAIIEAATAEGLDPGRLSRAQYTRLSIKVRSKVQLAKDVIKAGASLTTTTLGIKVSDEKAAKNKATCEKCPSGKFRILKAVVTVDGKQIEQGPPIPACDACNCQGAGLESKWKDPIQGVCPLGHWSNHGEDAQGRPVVIHGDAQHGA